MPPLMAPTQTQLVPQSGVGALNSVPIIQGTVVQGPGYQGGAGPQPGPPASGQLFGSGVQQQMNRIDQDFDKALTEMDERISMHASFAASCEARVEELRSQQSW